VRHKHRPMVYVGESCSKKALDRMRALGWGQCCTAGPTAAQELPFLFDNGAWPAFCEGKPFPEAKFFGRIERAYDRGQRPDFIVLPDVVANATATFELSSRWHPMLPVEWPKYLALQDGMEQWRVGAFLQAHICAGLFLGGTDWFKNNHARSWCDFAHERGLKFHYARAGTPRKFEHAIVVGADSLDSSRLSRDGRRWSDFARCRHIWLKGGHPRLFDDAKRREVAPAVG
jgi:hypothetical protein